jgi:hypothetical protein
MKYTLILVTLLLIIWYFVFKKRHTFWDHQPVSRGNMTHEGLVSETIPSPLGVKNPNELITVDPKDISLQSFLPGFLNKHYVNEYTYDQKYISWVLDFPHLTSNNMTTIQNSGKIIGTILSKPYTIKLNDTVLHSHYVDKLSVHENHRNKKYAPVLISNMLKNSCDERYKTCIFKKEENALPFNYICKSTYCVYDIVKPLKVCPSYSLKSSTDEDLNYIQNLYEKESTEYKCYPIFDEEQMKYTFTTIDGVYESMLVKVGDTPKGVITYSINSVRNKRTKRAEIVLLICEDINVVEVIKALINRCHKLGINELMCVNMAKNGDFIHKLKFTSEMPVYFQMYNYNLKNPLKPSDILFNFI